jgi:hypothetical protein
VPRNDGRSSRPKRRGIKQLPRKGSTADLKRHIDGRSIDRLISELHDRETAADGGR